MRDWVPYFSTFVKKPHMTWRLSKNTIEFDEVKNKEAEVNTFDIAHLADFVQVADYIKRFELAPELAVSVAAPKHKAAKKKVFGVKQSKPPSPTDALRSVITKQLAALALRRQSGGRRQLSATFSRTLVRC